MRGLRRQFKESQGMAEPPKASRREFLSGKSAAHALGEALIGQPPPLPPPKTVGVQPGSHLLSVSREAMACLFEIVFDAATYREGSDAAVAALALVARLEDQLTIYRETSEVAQLNRQAANGPVVVEAGLFGLLTRTVELYEATDGAFDITAGRLIKVWGSYRRQGRMPSPGEIAEALAAVDSRHLQLDPATSSVRFTQPGLELNLGAIGKGYALDRAADALTAAGVGDFVIHGGNSSVLARGSRQNSEFRIQNSETAAAADSAFCILHSAWGWTVALRHPLRPEVRLAEFVLCDQALGTSGSGTQYFHYQGRRYGHILDPRSGWPADQVLSATVIAPTAEQADALATAFYVMGLDATRAFCNEHPDVWALIATTGPTSGGIELTAINLPDDRWRRVEAGK